MSGFEADREADLFELFARPRRPASDLLIRLAQNRRVAHAARLLEPAMELAPLPGELEDITTIWELLHATDSNPPPHDVGKAQLLLLGEGLRVRDPDYDISPMSRLPELLKI